MIFRLLKVLLLLLFGAALGFFLGLAYASHLFGSDLVFKQLAHLVAGDAAIDVPMSVDNQEAYQIGTAVLIPKLGTCIGFGIAAAVMLGSISFGIAKTLILNAEIKKGASSTLVHRNNEEEPSPSSSEFNQGE